MPAVSDLVGRCATRLTRHLNENNQTYFEHLRDAWGYSLRSGLAMAFFFVHGLFPFTFEHTGSDLVKEIQDIVDEKQRLVAES
jgi:hypothetical protein